MIFPVIKRETLIKSKELIKKCLILRTATNQIIIVGEFFVFSLVQNTCLL